MNKATALKIYSDLQSKDYNDEDKVRAIHEIVSMATLNSISKASMIECIKYLLTCPVQIAGEDE